MSACASTPEPAPATWRDRVVLLPGRDGSAGRVTVTRGTHEVVLDRPYTAVRADAAGAPEVASVDPGAIRSEFADALRALPPAPVEHLVFFVLGQDELTDESRKAIGPILQEIARRPAPEITVTGHADQLGPESVNDALSLKRAERVKVMLIELGVPAARIVAAGRGAREPLVHAEAGAAEPRNRRVEISVR